MEKEQSLTGITVCRKPIQKPIRISEETHTWLARSAFFGLFQRLAKDFACALHALLIGVRIHAQGNGLIAVSELFRDACNVRAGSDCNARESVPIGYNRDKSKNLPWFLGIFRFVPVLFPKKWPRNRGFPRGPKVVTSHKGQNLFAAQEEIGVNQKASVIALCNQKGGVGNGK